MTDQTPERTTPVITRATPSKPQSRDRSTQVLLVLGALVAVAGLSFAGGRFTAPTSAAAANSTARTGFNGFRNGSFNPGNVAGRGGLGGLSGGVEGTVESVNGTSLTIQLANGNTATVDLGPATTYHSETAATATDVKSGAKILVTIDTSAFQPAAGASGAPAPGASGAPGGGFQNRTFTAKDVIIVTP